MRKKIKHIVYQVFNPSFSWRPKEGLDSLKRKMNIYFKTHKKIGEKYREELEFINRVSKDTYSWIFPYPYIKSLSIEDIPVFFNSDKNLHYVIHNDKRLYFKKEINTEEKVRIAYYCACIEQHEESPHCYLNEEFNIQRGVVLDVGAAEGILGLEHIEKIDKLYLFEAQKEWIEALEATFEPWKDKVIIINKYVSDVDFNDDIRLDTIIKDDSIELVKIDVEGAEQKIFLGGNNVLKRTRKLCVCTYHNDGDEKKFKDYLEKMGFNLSYSDGYTLFIMSKLYPPYFRKCLIRGHKI
ncbi:MAG: FkbM family methyltransferase [Paludibacteraceae bacterium]|nr:FkbM family methyltransferase [Paludibacteraceae bacterium]